MSVLVYMTHPQHGRMPVYSPRQRDENLKNGWQVEAAPVNATPAEPVRRGPGRPPNPRKEGDE